MTQEHFTHRSAADGAMTLQTGLCNFALPPRIFLCHERAAAAEQDAQRRRYDADRGGETIRRHGRYTASADVLQETFPLRRWSAGRLAGASDQERYREWCKARAHAIPPLAVAPRAKHPLPPFGGEQWGTPWGRETAKVSCRGGLGSRV